MREKEGENEARGKRKEGRGRGPRMRGEDGEGKTDSRLTLVRISAMISTGRLNKHGIVPPEKLLCSALVIPCERGIVHNCSYVIAIVFEDFFFCSNSSYLFEMIFLFVCRKETHIHNDKEEKRKRK